MKYRAAAKGRRLSLLGAVCLISTLLVAPAAEATRSLPAALAPALGAPVAPAQVFAEMPAEPQTRYRLFGDLTLPERPLELVQIQKTASGFSTCEMRLNIWQTGGLSQNCSGPSFQGLWTDRVTGISYARNRWYDARTASWLSEDPKGAIDSPNLYAFVGWGPQAGRDPFGDLTWGEAWAFTKGATKTAAIGVGAVAVGAGAVAVGIASAPVVVVAGIGVGTYALINRTAERYDQATDLDPNASLGESTAVALGDISGITGFVEAGTGTEVNTGRVLTSEERYGRAGEGTGAVVTAVAAPAIARGVHGALSFDEVGLAAQQGMRDFGRELGQSSSIRPTTGPASGAVQGSADAGIPEEMIGGGRVVAAEDLSATVRLSRDSAVNPVAPDPLPLNRPIGTSAAQQAALQADIEFLQRLGAFDIRVNQQQVALCGSRVGICRPDLQASLARLRILIEYDRPPATRAIPHAERGLANDPMAVYILKTIE